MGISRSDLYNKPLYKPNIRSESVQSGTTVKTCKRCKISMNMVMFFSVSNSRHSPPDGYDSWCKACRKEYRKAYYLKNIEREKKISKEWQENNRGEIRNWYVKNREKILAKVKERRRKEKLKAVKQVIN